MIWLLVVFRKWTKSFGRNYTYYIIYIYITIYIYNYLIFITVFSGSHRSYRPSRRDCFILLVVCWTICWCVNSFISSSFGRQLSEKCRWAGRNLLCERTLPSLLVFFCTQINVNSLFANYFSFLSLTELSS